MTQFTLEQTGARTDPLNSLVTFGADGSPEVGADQGGDRCSSSDMASAARTGSTEGEANLTPCSSSEYRRMRLFLAAGDSSSKRTWPPGELLSTSTRVASPIGDISSRSPRSIRAPGHPGEKCSARGLIDEGCDVGVRARFL